MDARDTSVTLDSRGVHDSVFRLKIVAVLLGERGPSTDTIECACGEFSQARVAPDIEPAQLFLVIEEREKRPEKGPH